MYIQPINKHLYEIHSDVVIIQFVEIFMFVIFARHSVEMVDETYEKALYHSGNPWTFGTRSIDMYNMYNILYMSMQKVTP